MAAVAVIGAKRSEKFKGWEERLFEILSKYTNCIWIDRMNPVLIDTDVSKVINLFPHALDLAVRVKKHYDAELIQYWYGQEFECNFDRDKIDAIDRHLAISKWSAKQIESYYDITPDVNYLGVDLKYVPPYSLPRKDFFVYIGGCWPHKQVEWLPENTILVGNGTLKAKYGERATGYVSNEEKFRYLLQAKALIHPSRSEGFGLTITEALSVGTPCLLYDLPVYHELYSPLIGKYVFLFSSKEELDEMILKEYHPNRIECSRYILNKGLTLQHHVERLMEWL